MSIFDTTCSKVLLPWTVRCLDDQVILSGCFEMVLERSSTAISEHIVDHKLKEVYVGMTKDALDLVSPTEIQAYKLTKKACCFPDLGLKCTEVVVWVPDPQ